MSQGRALAVALSRARPLLCGARGRARWCASSSAPGAKASAEKVGDGDAAAAPEADAAEAEPVDLAAEIAKRDSALAEMNERVLRSLAEMENVRTIARRDVDNARQFGITAFARSMLSVADNLGLALLAVPPDRLEADDALRGLHDGVAATEKELLKVLAQNGVTRFGEIGDRFDPNKYQAMFEAPAPDVEPGTVINVSKIGYFIGDRVLRPAEVGVARAPST